MQSPRIGLILTLEEGCIPLYLVKVPFWDSYYIHILTFYFNIFDEKCKLGIKRKKKKMKKKKKKKLTN